MKLTLRESSLSDDLELTTQDLWSISALRYAADGGKAAPVLRVRAGSLPGMYRLETRSVIGAVQVGRLQIKIEPRCSDAVVTHMILRSSLSSRTLELTAAHSGSFVDQLFEAFAHSVGRVVPDHIVQNYQRVNEIGTRPRGSLHLGWTQGGIRVPLRYSFDQFTEDNPENQLLRAALDKVAHMRGQSDELGASVARLRDLLEVRDLTTDPLSVVEDSEVADYSDVLPLAYLIVTGGGVGWDQGALKAPGLLLDMNRIFEKFIQQTLKDAAPSADVGIDIHGRSHPRWIDIDKKYRMEPDAAAWRGGRCVLIVDAKYKELGGLIPRSDVYQMESYLQAHSASEGLLVYARGGPTQTLTTSEGIHIRTINLNLDHAHSGAELEQELIQKFTVGLKGRPLDSNAAVTLR